MSKKSLLIEIGTEELPAIPLLKVLKTIEKKWQNILEQNNLQTNFKFFYTPRRLVFWHTEFLDKQPNKTQEFFGAPLHVAYKDNQPTPAALGFAKKCGVSIDDIKTTKKGKNEVLYYQKEIDGSKSEDILPIMIKDLIGSLDFGKAMRWGDRSDSFIRPIRWLNVMLDNQLVDCELFGVKSKKTTYGHRSNSYEEFKVETSGDYFCNLPKMGVILDQNERKEKILAKFKELEKEHQIDINIDDELLNEVIAITEYPTPLLGEFEKSYLVLPQEIIITSMKEHQRYFPVFKNNKLSNNFIVVSNALTDDFSKVVLGNQKVLKPRLADGLFFYNNDLKRGLDNSGLEKVTFMKNLGSMIDKVERETQIVKDLNIYFDLSLDSKLLEQASNLSKADLMSEVVYEFTELQGLMGYYYSKAQNLDDNVSLAIKEQYLPDGEDSSIPSTKFSALIALSYKLDILIGLFSINQIPTGSRDPFGLRRAVIGILKIVHKHQLEFDLNEVFTLLKPLYKEFDFNILEKFFIERVNQFYKDINPSIIYAVIQTGERNLLELDKKIKALDSVIKNDSFKEDFSTFKRVANIIKDVDFVTIKILPELFELEQETDLYNRFIDIKDSLTKEYDKDLVNMFSIKPELDAFFDKVMVNHEDENIRNNRKSLISSIYLTFRTIADLKEISV